jgi:hypothetical protein
MYSNMFSSVAFHYANMARRSFGRSRWLLNLFLAFLVLIILRMVTSEEYKQLWTRPKSHTTPTVNLVVATTSSEDVSWTYDLKIPNLTVVPYVADPDPRRAQLVHHPRLNKGKEANIYLSYINDFYDDLPDISIFIHADNVPWHIETLLSNMTFTLNNLNLEEVQRQKYVNLRASWQFGCPNWINTTVTSYNETKKEQMYMAQAFQELFPGDDVPEIFSAPCCSQFAVTRETIQKIPRERYSRFLNWLAVTNLEDDISGRVWEHLWPYLFLKTSVNCPLPSKTYCELYGICYEDQADFNAWEIVDNMRRELEGEWKWLVEHDSENREDFFASEIPYLRELSGSWRNEAILRGLRRTRNAISRKIGL